MPQSCSVLTCDRAVSKEGYELCYPHWKAQRDGDLTRCESCGRLFESRLGGCPACEATGGDRLPSSRATLSSTKLGERFGLSPVKMNLVLAELGWIEKYIKGWTPTDAGNRVGAEVREARQTGVPYVVWPESVEQNKSLRRSVAEVKGESVEEDVPAPVDVSAPAHPASDAEDVAAFRAKYPAKIRTRDGHFVRSRAEAMIDDYLYDNGIVHAYERRLPVDDNAYCDFYLPQAKVYIEFWGLEDDPRYAQRQADKRAIYAKHNLKLIELADREIESLDDTLPKLLLKHGVLCT